MKSLLDLVPIFIIGGGLVVFVFWFLYCCYRGGTVRCIKCSKYRWKGTNCCNNAGDVDSVDHGSCSTSAVTEESK